MPKWLRLWGKKRGARRAGSPRVGSFGEVVFFALVALAGAFGLGVMLSLEFTTRPLAPYYTTWLGWLAYSTLASLMILGVAGWLPLVLYSRGSRERRSAAAKTSPGGALADGAASDAALAGPRLAGGASPAARLDDSALRIAGEASSSPRFEDYPTVPGDDDCTNSPGVRLAYRLPVASVEQRKFYLAAASCLLWSFVAAALGLMAFDSLRLGRGEWLLPSMALLFVGVGLWSVLYLARQLVRQFGLGPTVVEISELPLRPGERYRIFLSQAGRLKIPYVEIALVCEEEAAYRQGTDLRVERREVLRRVLARFGDVEAHAAAPWEQELEFQTPVGAMHSFRGRSNAVNWKLEVRGKARGWPPFRRQYPLVMYPPREEAAAWAAPAHSHAPASADRRQAVDERGAV